MKPCNRLLGTATECPLLGNLRICQTNIHQDEEGMYFFLWWSFGLEYIPSGMPFQASESTQESRDLSVCTFVGAFQLSPVGAVTLGREHVTVHCIGHWCWSDYLGPSSPSPRPISPYCSAQTSQVWNFDWKQKAPVLNTQQTRPRSCSCLLPLCSRRTSPLLTSSMALACEAVHACHPMTQPPLQEG